MCIELETQVYPRNELSGYLFLLGCLECRLAWIAGLIPGPSGSLNYML